MATSVTVLVSIWGLMVIPVIVLVLSAITAVPLYLVATLVIG